MCSGLMPHPENLIDPLVGGIDGRGLFESLLQLKLASTIMPATAVPAIDHGLNLA